MKDLLPKVLIVFTILYLENFLNLVNISMLVYIPLVSGISLNLKDLLIIGFLVYYVGSAKKDRVSFHLKLLLIYLGFCLFAITLMSIFAYGASLGIIGNRLRYYFSYTLILGLIMLVDGETHFRFFLKVIFGIGMLACCIHFVEYIRGSQFYIPGSKVGKHFMEGSGTFQGIARLWNRASNTSMIMFALSAGFLASNIKNKMIFIVPFVFALASISLSFTRTIYIFVLVTMLTIFLTSIAYKEGKPVFVGVLLLILCTLGPMYILKTSPDLLYAVGVRFQTIISSFTEGIEGTTMGARQQQFEFIKQQMADADIPPVFGIGITNKTAKYMTSDLGYMNIVVNMGVLGILFILFFFAYLYNKSRFLMNKAHDDLHKIVGMSIFSMLPGLLIIGYNFDFLTGTHFTLLALPVILLEAAIYRVERSNAVQDRDLSDG